MAKKKPNKPTAPSLPDLKATTVRFPVDLLEWIDNQAAELHMSRNQWITYVLTMAKKHDQAMTDAGLFDEMAAAMERAMISAIDNLPKPDRDALIRRISG